MTAEGREKRTNGYVYRPGRTVRNYEKGIRSLSEEYKVVDGAVNHVDSQALEAVQKDFERQRIRVNEWTVNVKEYRDYFERAAYRDLYPDYYEDFLAEKSFEHFIAFRLLDIRPGEIFLDVASENSPIAEIYSRLTGCVSYRQDIMYPPGINGNTIGGDACEMPVPGQFAHKITLTCSLERFEGDGDCRLFRELSRVLKPGGKVCVVPFYVYTSPANQIDPPVSIPNCIPLDKNATIYCARGWGNRFARFYSSVSFVERILNPAGDLLSFEVFRIMNADEVHPNVYARFALLAARK